MVAAQRFGNLLERLRAFHLCLTLPVEREPLTTNAATNIRRIATALAQNLHFDDLAELRPATANTLSPLD
jgi:hypothetical protein